MWLSIDVATEPRLQDKTNTLIDVYKDIMRIVEELSTCQYTTAAFAESLGKIQAAVSGTRELILGITNLVLFLCRLTR